MRLGRRLSSGIAEDPPTSEPAEPTREPAATEVATADARPTERREHAAHLAER